MTTPLVPVIEDAVASNQAPEDVFMAQSETVVDDRNWAKNDEVKAYIQTHIYSMLEQTRQDMASLHEEWRQVARMGALIHDEGQRYRGRSNAYIPAYPRARKTIVSMLSQGLFPTDEYLSVTDKERPNDSNQVNALAVKTYLQWEFEKNAQLRREMKPFLGSFIDYGYTVAKVWYDKHTKAPRRMTLKQAQTKMMTQDEYKKTVKREGLRFSTRSVFDFYVYPYNINNLDEATLIFEDVDVSRAYVLERKRTKQWENCDLMLEATEVSEHTQNRQEIEDAQQATATNQRIHAGSDIGDILTVTEIWVSMPMPKAALVEGEDPEEPIPVKIVMSGDIIAEVRRNPLWDQEPPYLVARDDPKAGSFFAKGTGFLVKSIQYLLNDFSNQMNDNGTMGMNPTVIINPSTMAGPVPAFKPGGIWETTDVANGVRFDRPPIEQIQYGMQLVSLYAGMLADFSGATPALQGQSAGKGGKTATGMTLLQKNAMNPLKDMVEDIEMSVMTPLMEKAWSLGQQYRDEDFMMEVMGDTGGWMPKSMTRSQLEGNYILRWLASNQAANSQQRAQQGIQLLQILTPPLVQLLAQQGHSVDPYVLLKRVYQDGMGFRDFDKFIKPMQQRMPPGMPGAPQEQLPPGMEGMQDPRSATLQNPQGADAEQQTMAPGEGDEFSALRQQIEAMTAEQGEQVPTEE